LIERCSVVGSETQPGSRRNLRVLGEV
jgi:hypothetical protein